VVRPPDGSEMKTSVDDSAVGSLEVDLEKLDATSVSMRAVTDDEAPWVVAPTGPADGELSAELADRARYIVDADPRRELPRAEFIPDHWTRCRP